MEKMAISEFKAKCLAVLERVRRLQKPLLITRFGEPVAEIVPPRAPRVSRGWLGSLRGTAKIVGDLVQPATEETDWEVLRS